MRPDTSGLRWFVRACGETKTERGVRSDECGVMSAELLTDFDKLGEAFRGNALGRFVEMIPQPIDRLRAALRTPHISTLLSASLRNPHFFAFFTVH